MELLVLLALLPLLLVAPLAEAWERRCERRRARAAERAGVALWRRLSRPGTRR